MRNRAYHSTDRADWETPECVLERVCAIDSRGIAVDPCAGVETQIGRVNIRHGRHSHGWYGDGLRLNWARLVEQAGGGLVYVNPPYGGRKRVIDAWVEKAIEERDRFVETAMLVPASTGARWFRRIHATGAAACAWAGRLRFVMPGGTSTNSAPFWSWVVLWSLYISTQLRFLEAFDGAGDLYLLNQPPSPQALRRGVASGILQR